MDLNIILNKWDKAKRHKLLYEKECEQYRGAVERYMNKKEKNIIHGNKYIVSRVSNTRQHLSKQNVPPEIWDRYSTRSSYMLYRLKEI